MRPDPHNFEHAASVITILPYTAVAGVCGAGSARPVPLVGLDGASSPITQPTRTALDIMMNGHSLGTLLLLWSVMYIRSLQLII